jgi:hypothetical protein
MKRGYLVLETHPEHRGMIRAVTRDELPNTEDSEQGSAIRYIARFDDIEAGLMHLHNQLHHCLIDLDTRLYRADLKQAISAIESDDLHHQQVWMDPSIDAPTRAEIETQTARLKLSHRRWNTAWMMVGGFFVLLFFLFNLLNSF